MEMQLKDLADAFGWKICDLAEVIGYSTAGLYNIFKGRRIDRRRLNAAIDHLKLISQIKYEQAIRAEDKTALKSLEEKQKRDECLNNMITMMCNDEKMSDVRY